MTMAVFDLKAAMNTLDDEEVFDFLVQAFVEGGTHFRAAAKRPAPSVPAAATRTATTEIEND